MFTKFNTHFHNNSIFACIAHGAEKSGVSPLYWPPKNQEPLIAQIRTVERQIQIQTNTVGNTNTLKSVLADQATQATVIALVGDSSE